MIVLQPHALKGGVLFAVPPAPRYRFWISRLKQDTNASIDNGDPAEPTTMTVSFDEASPQHCIRRARLGTIGNRYKGRRIGVFSYTENRLIVRTPDRFGPLANSRHVGGRD